MAQINAVPAPLRTYAEKVPADIRDRLTAGELNARCRTAAEHASRADQADAETFRHLHKQSKMLLCALPAAEFVAEANRLNELAQNASRQTQVDEDGHQYTLRGAWLDKKRKLADDNPYPPGLLEAIESAPLSKQTGYPDLDALALACIRAAR